MNWTSQTNRSRLTNRNDAPDTEHVERTAGPEKDTYLVSVSNLSVVRIGPGTEPIHSEYEFTIEATEQEAGRLSQLLETQRADDFSTFVRTPIPYKSADRDEATKDYNEQLLRVYSYLYELGTPRTRDHIERTGLLAKLRHPDYSHPGYRDR
ncbi:hypothetical protein [Paenibacillus sp. GCM10012303]|uniref:hypothetical protein n=1 Tax=Paenibacillus sp. GCM10012303 TaxID=3317340 RepID=UPI0036170FF8